MQGYLPEAHHHGISRKKGTRFARLIVCQADRGWVELDGERLPVARVAEAAGIEDPFYFSRRFRKIMGTAPSMSAMKRVYEELLREHFAGVLKVPHAFQAVMEMEGVDADCFEASRAGKPLRVPLRTLLSQLA